MAYDHHLADRIHNALATINPPSLMSKNMFGGIGYKVRGNMACGILDDQLIVRVGKSAYEEMLSRPGVHIFDTRSQPMAGWVIVDDSALVQEENLLDWVNRGIEYALTLPKK